MEAVIDYRGKTPEKTTFGVPLITAKVVKDGRIETPNEFIAIDDYEAWMRRGMPKAGDVVITTEAPLGEVAQLGAERVALAQRLIALRGKSGTLDNGFLKFLMQSENVQDQLRARASGTTVLGIKQSELRKIRLTIPPFSEQRAIAHILGTLDDKIELNRRMNETLEAMARALFKSWFVDFDPVRAKAAGRDPALPKDLAALFPNSFQPSALGEIPKGWLVLTLEKVCRTVTRGVTPKYENGSRRYIINQRVNRGNQLDLSELKELSLSIDVPTDCYAKRWDVLVNCLGEGTLGRVHLFRGDSDKYAVDQHMSICRGMTSGAGVYIYQVLASPSGQEKINSLKTGSTGMTMFNISKLRGYYIVWPGDALVQAFFQIVEPLFAHVAVNDEESRRLADLRDVLLPKLISGELRILEQK